MAKKIGILTWFIGSNIGAVLQAKALQFEIEKIMPTYKCETITYQTEEQVRLKRNCKLSRVFINFIRHKNINRLVVELYMFPIQKLRRKKIDQFIDYNIQVSPFYIGKEIEKSNQRYDIFICGSDQIWNPEWLDEIYLLNFVSASKKRIAYAPSVGVDSISNEVKNKMQAELQKYFAISVREKQSADMIQKLVPMKKVADVCDPALLLTKKEWNEILHIKKIKRKKPYILCYFLGSERKHRTAAREFADKKGGGMPIINLIFANGFCKADIKFGDKNYYIVTPKQFVALITGAAFVFTDSFHGVVFSLIEEKQFFVFGRTIVNQKGNKILLNSRVENLLEKVNLLEQIIDAEKENAVLKCMTNKIDYTVVLKYLNKYRTTSVKWLKEAITEEENPC